MGTRGHHEHPHGHGHTHGHPHTHGHDHEREAVEPHGHTHGGVDPSIASTSLGLWALKWSFAGLMGTALLQIVVVYLSGSVALLADTVHNFADAASAIPLAIAFLLTRLGKTRRFSYGLGRVEDFAGLTIVALIGASSILTAVQAARALQHPQTVELIWAVVAASVVGFIGNEAVAILRIRVGRKIGSAALVADGYHARIDGWTSLAVLVGALGVWAGYPLADPIVGLVISVAILFIVWRTAREILNRMLDATDPELLATIAAAASRVQHIIAVTDVRARWIGHRLHADVNVAVPGGLSVAEGHQVAKEVRHQVLHQVPNVGNVLVHVDPEGESGEDHHRIDAHAHDGLPSHSHH